MDETKAPNPARFGTGNATLAPEVPPAPPAEAGNGHAGGGRLTSDRLFAVAQAAKPRFKTLLLTHELAGEEMVFRYVTTGQRAEFEKSLMSGKPGKMKQVDTTDFTVKAICFTSFDPKLTVAHHAALKALRPETTKPMLDVALECLGMNDEDMEEITKNSPETPGATS